MGRRWPLLIGILAGLGAVWLGLQTGADAADQWGRAARWTARVGLPIFLVAYLASSLGKLWPGNLTRTIWQQRRWWGLAFAACHTIHLYALVRALDASGDVRTFASLIPGGSAYVFIFLMALTSNDAAMRLLGRNWKRLHTVGIHYIWLIYTLAYAGRLFDPAKMAEGVYGVTLALSALGLRILAWRAGRRREMATA